MTTTEPTLPSLKVHRSRLVPVVWALFCVALIGAIIAVWAMIRASDADQRANHAEARQDTSDRRASAAAKVAEANAAGLAAANAQIARLGGTPVATPSSLPGPAGRGIARTLLVRDHLIVTYTDGDTTDVGQVVGAAGPPGKNGSPGASGASGASGRPGSPGVGIASAAVSSDGHLLVTFTDGTTSDLGVVVGHDGAPGQDGKAGRGVASVAVSDSGHLIVTYTDGTTSDAGQVPTGPVCPSGYTLTTHPAPAPYTGETWAVCASTPPSSPTPSGVPS